MFGRLFKRNAYQEPSREQQEAWAKEMAAELAAEDPNDTYEEALARVRENVFGLTDEPDEETDAEFLLRMEKEFGWGKPEPEHDTNFEWVDDKDEAPLPPPPPPAAETLDPNHQINLDLQTLGLPPTHDARVLPSKPRLKQYYRRKVMQVHPDHGGSEAAFVAAKDAYDRLMAL